MGIGKKNIVEKCQRCKRSCKAYCLNDVCQTAPLFKTGMKGKTWTVTMKLSKQAYQKDIDLLKGIR